MHDVALMVRLAGRRVVGVGAGPVAAGKLLPLLDAGAALTVIAPCAADDLAAAAATGRLLWHQRDYAGAEDLRGAVLVVAATGNPSVDALVAAAAAAAATLCVRSGPDPERTGGATFPATLRRGPVTIAVSTGGEAPTLARHLRVELADRYGPEYADLAALLGELRRDPAVRAALATLDEAGRRAAWRALPLADILRLSRTRSVQSAIDVAAPCRPSSAA